MTADVAGATSDLFRGLGLDEVREAGRGATCTVYVARQPALLRMVAVKYFNKAIVDDKQQRRFERECQTLAGLQHPNILTLYSTGLDGAGRPYILMEYCTGGSLADILTTTGAMTVPEVLRIGIKLSSALQLAHDRDVLHRDIKPANALLTELGEPKLADFGIASDAGELSMTVGDSLTPLFAAPEVLESGGGSRASDVWSLASTLYALLLGRAPYAPTGTTGEGFLALLERIVRDPLPKLQRPDVSAALQNALERGMEKDPSNRTATAREFAMLLQDVQRSAGLPITEYLASAADAASTIARASMPQIGEQAGVSSPAHPSGSRFDFAGVQPPANLDNRTSTSDARTLSRAPSTVPRADAVQAAPQQARASWKVRGWAIAGVAILALLGCATAVVATQHHGGHPSPPVTIGPISGFSASCALLECSLKVHVEGDALAPGAQLTWTVGRSFREITPGTQTTLDLTLPRPGIYTVVVTETQDSVVVASKRATLDRRGSPRIVDLREASADSLTARVESTDRRCARDARGTLQIRTSGIWRTNRHVELSGSAMRIHVAQSGRYRIHLPASTAPALCEERFSRPVNVQLLTSTPRRSTAAYGPSAQPSATHPSTKPRNPVSPSGSAGSTPKDPVHP
ncbi:MAG TPA: serine/threonine-protein kinase [Mycobacteriales bacterium]|nr:serine/threonine-protein kinase [Mycobacteriales bacterium]